MGWFPPQLFRRCSSYSRKTIMTAALLAGWRGAGGHNSRGALNISTQAEICPLDFRGEFRDNYLEMMSYHLARTNLAPNSWVRRANVLPDFHLYPCRFLLQLQSEALPPPGIAKTYSRCSRTHLGTARKKLVRYLGTVK